MKKAAPQEGYIALVSAIVISVLLITITVGLGLDGIFSRLNILDSESKTRSIALAEACADTAILNVAQGNNQPANPVTIGSDQCTIRCALSAGSNTTIETQANFNKAYTNLKVVIDNNTLTIVSWEEYPNLNGACN